MIENTESLLIEQKQDMPEMPSYLKERNISNYGTAVRSTIIVVCALISLIINIKRKSTIRIILSIILFEESVPEIVRIPCTEIVLFFFFNSATYPITASWNLSAKLDAYPTLI